MGNVEIKTQMVDSLTLESCGELSIEVPDGLTDEVYNLIARGLLFNEGWDTESESRGYFMTIDIVRNGGKTSLYRSPSLGDSVIKPNTSDDIRGGEYEYEDRDEDCTVIEIRCGLPAEYYPDFMPEDPGAILEGNPKDYPLR